MRTPVLPTHSPSSSARGRSSVAGLASAGTGFSGFQVSRYSRVAALSIWSRTLLKMLCMLTNL